MLQLFDLKIILLKRKIIMIKKIKIIKKKISKKIN